MCFVLTLYWLSYSITIFKQQKTYCEKNNRLAKYFTT